MTDFEIILYSFILVLLIVLAAFFSIAETGLMAVNRYRLRHQARLKRKYAVIVLKMLKRPDRLLGAILLGSTFANMLASALATLLAFHFWGDKGALLSALLLTIIVLIFAEIGPKTIAAIYPDKIVRLVAYPIQFLLKLLYPAVLVVNWIVNNLLRIFKIHIEHSAVEPLTRDELRTVVYDTTNKIPRQYQNMLLGILDLSKLAVDDVMVPRHDILGVDIEQPWERMLDQIQKFSQGGFVPVYRENVNQIIGILYTRDILRLVLNQKTMNKELIQHHLQEPYFVPEGTSLSTQLSYFQQSHHKIAFVVDEYGEIQGMLTLNDILEEIVGDFTQSLALGKRIQKQIDNSYLVDGSMTVREFNRLTEWNLPIRGPRTINGLIIEYLEALPHAGTAILIQGYPLEIVQVKENRVKMARIFPKLK